MKFISILYYIHPRHDNEDSAESSFMDLEVEIIPRNAPPVRTIMMNIPLDIRMNGGRVVRGDPNRVVVRKYCNIIIYYVFKIIFCIHFVKLKII